jgi:glycosyltransferase involved in cell wall biosynthesis
VVGEGDHRPDLEAEIERRGLSDRVRMHGYVDDETKAELYGRAWVNLTASQSEGWSLTVMEAALCRTPSVALSVGGLAESVVEGETGFLAADLPQMIDRVRRLVDEPELRDRFGAAAEQRARTFSWDRSARAFLDVLRRVAGRAPSADPEQPAISMNGHAHDHERSAAENR